MVARYISWFVESLYLQLGASGGKALSSD